MIKNIQVNAAILIIGNEILSGRTQDTNTSTLALWLNSIGVKVGEVRVIPDIEQTIIENVNELRKNNNYVFVADVSFNDDETITQGGNATVIPKTNVLKLKEIKNI